MRFLSKRLARPSLPPGIRMYVIGDVHGRVDLLRALLDDIRRDDATREGANTIVVQLGDMIDRGPDSAGVVDLMMTPLGWARTIVLKGNHEAMLLQILDGADQVLPAWLHSGGRAALASWGIDPLLAEDPDIAVETIVDLLVRGIPSRQRDWLRRRPLSYRLGDYYFVHAGVMPGVPLERQREEHSLWIREQFLTSRADHGAVVVHGHSVVPRAEQRFNRIGVDTGAYASGRLTALGLEGSRRWMLDTASEAPVEIAPAA
jgi:serine/threonine protein phosphatase 1